MLKNILHLACAFVLLAGSAAQAKEPPAVVTVTGPMLEQPLIVDAELMHKLERESVVFHAHTGTATYEGVPLQAILERAGVPFGEHLHGKYVRLYLVVGARDGFHAVFSIMELAPQFGDTTALLADTRNGKPLSDFEGPYRLVLPGDEHPSRSVRQVTTITLKYATPER